ncbi:phosphatidylinositol-glycan biosynthesis class W protein [Drosophila innubila]|uniref:phosphatidylinositol-glycan biosynthesis class W protein n=1 Tax=Drosophila innubila TaxID=198719 RepID=UPI00148D92D2|nr:phosphatidylinositol-glycan biosynthesis class W protein [Drosophila innubila]
MSWPGLDIGSTPGKGYYYDVYNSADKCVLSAPLHIFQSYLVNVGWTPIVDLDLVEVVEYRADKKSWQSVQSSVRSFLMVMPILLGFTLSQLLCQHLSLNSTRRFLLEFLLIAVPTVCNMGLTTQYNCIYAALVAAHIVFQLWRSGVWSRSAAETTDYIFKVGRRPIVFTLIRATAYVGTGAAILAIDFKQFLVSNGKSRDFGATIMDVGIGLFVVTMGLVSQRARHLDDVKKLPKAVLPLLVLGLARTVVITMIDYHQDEREYGKHLNAFFTLGLTKLFGSLCTLLAPSDKQLLPLSLGILGLHELILQLGLSEYIMLTADRKGFLDSNREGLSALPGCISLYLLSIYLAKWYTSKDQLNYTQFFAKLCHMLIYTITGWILVTICAFTCGIARVTFNTGYIIWLFSICVTLMLLYAFLFEFALVSARQNTIQIPDSIKSPSQVAQSKSTDLPVIVESLNMNGLTHFMISNFLTGFINMTLEPKQRNSVESIIILTLYMLSTACIVYVLFRKKIRIA